MSLRPSQSKRFAGFDDHYEPNQGVPRVVIVLLLLIGIVYAVRFILPYEVHEAFVRFLALVPGRVLAQDPGDPVGVGHDLMTFVTHAFVHADFGHLLFNGIWLLIFGTMMATRFRAGRAEGTIVFLCYYLSAAVFSGIVFVLMNIGENVLLIGASGALSALMAGGARIGFRRLPMADGRMSRPLALTDRRVIGVTLLYIALNAIVATPLGGLVAMTNEAGNVAWEIHIVGFLYGLVTMPFFDRLANARRGDVL